jgi:hypothetical protein
VCLGRTWTDGGFTLALFQGWSVGGDVLLEQVQLNFRFQNKFIIVLPWGHQVHNNTFLEVCIFTSLTGYTDEYGYETKTVCFNSTKIKCNEVLIMVILNCILLHNQNDGLCPNLYFSDSHKYVYKTHL